MKGTRKKKMIISTNAKQAFDIIQPSPASVSCAKGSCRPRGWSTGSVLSDPLGPGWSPVSCRWHGRVIPASTVSSPSSLPCVSCKDTWLWTQGSPTWQGVTPSSQDLQQMAGTMALFPSQLTRIFQEWGVGWIFGGPPFHQLRHPLMMKSLRKMGRARALLCLIKSVYKENPQLLLELKGAGRRNQASCPLSALCLLALGLESLQTGRQTSHTYWRARSKTDSILNWYLVYLEYSKKTHRKTRRTCKPVCEW